jgi:hypothetical protein
MPLASGRVRWAQWLSASSPVRGEEQFAGDGVDDLGAVGVGDGGDVDEVGDPVGKCVGGAIVPTVIGDDEREMSVCDGHLGELQADKPLKDAARPCQLHSPRPVADHTVDRYVSQIL